MSEIQSKITANQSVTVSRLVKYGDVQQINCHTHKQFRVYQQAVLEKQNGGIKQWGNF